MALVPKKNPERPRLTTIGGLEPPSKVILRQVLTEFLRRDQLQDYLPSDRQLEHHIKGARWQHRLFRAGNQLGKALKDDEPVLTTGGFVPMWNLRVGDEVFGSDGRPTRVVGVFPQGVRTCYRVSTSDETSIVADAEHLWTVRKSTGKRLDRPWKLKTTTQLMTGTRYDLPPRPILEPPAAQCVLDPYLLGLLLGDGSFRTTSVTLTTTDEEIAEYCRLAAERIDCDLVRVKDTRRCASYRFRRRGGRNLLVSALKGLGLAGLTSHDKHIPEVYQFASPEARLALLRGLMDTDGTISANESRLQARTYSTVSDRLANDVLRLARGLGMQATLHVKNGRYKGEVHRSWRVSLRTGGHRVFALKRKMEIEQRAWRDARNLLVRRVEPAGEHSCTCIKVENDDGIFLAGTGLIPTHNTYCAGAEFAMHVTGEYPPGWKGFRFNRPIVAWVAGKSASAVRDTCQRILFGDVGEEEFGLGLIPQRCILTGKKAQSWSTNETGLLDYQLVRHASGGTSRIKFLYYSQNVNVWMGDTVDFIWFDEEPPLDKYNEGMARTIKTGGRSQMSFTPLNGRSQVYLYYCDPEHQKPGHTWTRMTIHESPAIPRERVEEEIAKWPAHERTARIYGDPMVGEGLIFAVDESLITCDPFPIPAYWPQGGSMDFGMAHPFGGVRFAWDRDTDTVFITAEYREVGTTAADDVLTLKHWGAWLPWFWPPDGSKEEKTSGAQVAEEYRKEGLKMHYEHSHYAEAIDPIGGYRSATSVERGINDMLTRMKSGRWKVFSTCTKWHAERRLYHRKDGKIVKEEDDLLDASRGAVMMLRAAKVKERPRAAYRGTPDWQAI